MDYLVIDNVYTDEELEGIYKEIIELAPHAKVDGNSTASYQNGLLKKSGTGLFLDDYYGANRTKSRILQLNRKLFSQDILYRACNLNAYYGHLSKANSDYTLLNFYIDGQGYDTHHDTAILTAVTMFQVGEVSGGDFIFPDYHEIIKFKPNRMVIFPSCINHKADAIKASEGSYRISMAQFIDYKKD